MLEIKRGIKVSEEEWKSNGWYSFITIGSSSDGNPWLLLEKGFERAFWEVKTGIIKDYYLSSTNSSIDLTQ